MDRDDRRTAAALLATWAVGALVVFGSAVVAGAAAGFAVRTFEWVS